MPSTNPAEGTRSQLKRLSKHFSRLLVEQRPQGGRTVDFVSHAVVTGKLLALVPGVSIRTGHEHGDTWWAEIEGKIDGHLVRARDISTDPEPESAASRAICRAAMRFAGIGLELWQYPGLPQALEHLTDPPGSRPTTASEMKATASEMADNAEAAGALRSKLAERAQADVDRDYQAMADIAAGEQAEEWVEAIEQEAERDHPEG